MPEVSIRIKPLAIPVSDERMEVYRRVKDALRRAEEVANDRRVKVTVRLEALRLIAYIGQVLTGVLREAQIDEVEERLRKLEEEVGEART